MLGTAAVVDTVVMSVVDICKFLLILSRRNNNREGIVGVVNDNIFGGNNIMMEKIRWEFHIYFDMITILSRREIYH